MTKNHMCIIIQRELNGEKVILGLSTHINAGSWLKSIILISIM